MISWDTPSRFRRLKFIDLPLLVFAILSSVVTGALVTQSPVAAIALLVVGAGMTMALSKPELLFAAGIILLSVEPSRIFGSDSIAGQPETYKIVLYACVFPLLVYRGIAWQRAMPLVAYILVAILTQWFATPVSGLTTAQTTASMATLCLGWVVFAINWDWRRDHHLLKVLAWTPIMSMLIGFALQLSVYAARSPPRLQGATIPAWLGTVSFCAATACLVLHRREQWKWARWLGFVDVLILSATLTRGAVLALAIVAVPSLIRFGRHNLLAKNTIAVARLMILVVIVIAGAVVLAPALSERDERSTSYFAGQNGSHDITSGRIHAWAFAYEQAKINLAFGRGIGAGPIVGKSPGSPVGFTAQHNEYVRMLLEVGIIGGIILLATIASAMFSLVRHAPRSMRLDLAAIIVAFAIFSITENTLSAASVSVAFLLLLGISGSRARLLSQPESSDKRVKLTSHPSARRERTT